MTQALTFLDVLESPALMGPWFSEPSWDNWKTFSRAVFALPMEQGDVETYARFTQRTAAPTEAAREAWAIVGRRGGKSLFAAALATYAATFRDYRPYLKPGQRAYVLVMASDRDQAAEVMGYIQGFFDNVPALAGLVEKRRGRADGTYREVLRLTNRVTIRVQVASFRRLRGKTVVAAVCDEVSFWYDSEESQNPASEILKALRPSMLTIPGALLIGITSPYARRGVVWDTFRQHFGKDGDRVLVWKADTVAMNSSVDRGEIDRAYEDDAASARAEYGAEFREDLESYVSPEAVEGVTVKGRIYLPYDPRFKHFGFCDPAGGSGGDSMTIGIARHEGNRAVVCRTMEWRPPFSPDTATEEASEILKEYRLARVMGDRYAGDWPKDRFKAHGIAYQAADLVKSAYYQSLLPLINGGRVELLDHRKTTAQLLNLEKATGRSGKDTISHPPGQHDDLINAVAGACVLAMRKRMLEGHAPYVPPAAPKPTLNEQGEGVVVLVHRFETCVCGAHDMMLVGDEQRPAECPQRDWGWSRQQGPRYPTGGTRTLETVSREAEHFSRTLADLERAMKQQQR